MSHSVTITRTTTTTTTSAILVNTGFLKTVPGLLKLIETVLGAVIIALYFTYYPENYTYSEFTYFILMAVTFFIATAINLISCLLSISTATILPKTMFEALYHILAFVLYVAASIALIVFVDKHYRSRQGMLITAILGLCNSILYLASSFFSFKSFKGI